ncbi:LANO_0G10726g1_1 [Lachancea nothofagi CBS 11611]|uniref:LANO_0G10726g1_1 n=1 Tax=Lachancea nothofagi CBS 11611 TaxID=1266666 RepID=A0A1G4KJ92_9SACH|nr:LANO_0G10726g1_1 [Lachancea nothofagi CBS 11611]
MQPEGEVAYTLRKHEQEVTSLNVIHQDPYPLLVSGDLKGKLLVWNLVTRRPLAHYQLPTNAQVVSINYINNYLTVLSKDHTLRFLRLHDETSLKSSTAKTHGNDNCTLKEAYEIPINTLNFANVSIETITEDLYRLWSCNTVDSECFDVYTFDLKDPHSLKRKFNKINLHEALLKADNWDCRKSLDKTGIVMKFLKHNGVVYLGFECGFVVGLKILENEGVHPSLVVVYASSVHYPDPVLSLCAASDGHCIYSSSTSGVVGIHNAYEAPTDEYDDLNWLADGIGIPTNFTLVNSCIDLHTAEIGHLESLQDSLVAIDWKGQTLVFSHERANFTFSKQRSNVPIEDSNVGTFSAEKRTKNWIKASSMACLGERGSKQVQVSGAGERRRVSLCASRNWCFTGYEDGSIIMQSFHS